MENYKTIKELATELDYSKQRIQKIIENLPNNEKPKKRGNKYILFPSDENKIKQILGVDKSNNKNIEDFLAHLISETNIKNKRIEKLERLLDQQQQLTLQANKQIEQLQSQLFLTVSEESSPKNESEENEKKEMEKKIEKPKETTKEKNGTTFGKCNFIFMAS